VRIDSSDPRWRLPSPTPTSTIAGGVTPLKLWGCPPVTPERLVLLHGAITAILARPHNAPTPDAGRGENHVAPQWSIRPGNRQGWAWDVFWWSSKDAAALSDTMRKARIGRTPCIVEVCSSTPVEMPPRYRPGAHAVRITAMTPVCTRSNIRRDGRTKTTWRSSPSDAGLAGALHSLALRAGIDTEEPHAVIVHDATTPARSRLRGKVRGRRGWIGVVDVIANAPARWLLELASRGYGLGASVAYGMGSVEVRPC